MLRNISKHKANKVNKVNLKRKYKSGPKEISNGNEITNRNQTKSITMRNSKIELREKRVALNYGNRKEKI